MRCTLRLPARMVPGPTNFSPSGATMRASGLGACAPPPSSSHGALAALPPPRARLRGEIAEWLEACEHAAFGRLVILRVVVLEGRIERLELRKPVAWAHRQPSVP